MYRRGGGVYPAGNGAGSVQQFRAGCRPASAAAGGVDKRLSLGTKGKVNPLIGAAGVSAVPMAARIAQKIGREEDPDNYLLMHAMGPNVAGVIGSAVASGILITMLG